MKFPFTFHVRPPLRANPSCLVGATILVPQRYTIRSLDKMFFTYAVNFRDSSGELDAYNLEAVRIACASEAIMKLPFAEFSMNPYALLGLRVKITSDEELIVGYHYPYHVVQDAITKLTRRERLYDTVLTITGLGELQPPSSTEKCEETDDEDEREGEKKEASKDEEDDESESESEEEDEDDEVEAPPQKKRRAPETSRIDSVAAIAGAAASAAVAAVMAAKLASRRK